jgi:protein TonB
MKPDGLTWPLAVSALAHLTLLGIPLVAPRPDLQVMKTPALEVVLLNARRPTTQLTPPERALALSSTHSSGGGDAERGRARAPRLQTASPDQARVDVMQDQLGQLQLQQQALLGQLRQQAARTGEPMQKALAEIERRIQEENARPRTRYLGPSTREVVYAEYYDRMRHQIEALGTRQFPNRNGRPLYGALTLILKVDDRGRMAAIELVQSSGNAELDRRARAIANGAAPFGAFTPAMKRQADQLAWVIRFTFSAESGLQTEWFEPTPSPSRPR